MSLKFKDGYLFLKSMFLVEMAKAKFKMKKTV